MSVSCAYCGKIVDGEAAHLCHKLTANAPISRSDWEAAQKHAEDIARNAERKRREAVENDPDSRDAEPDWEARCKEQQRRADSAESALFIEREKLEEMESRQKDLKAMVELSCHEIEDLRQEEKALRIKYDELLGFSKKQDEIQIVEVERRKDAEGKLELTRASRDKWKGKHDELQSEIGKWKTRHRFLTEQYETDYEHWDKKHTALLREKEAMSAACETANRHCREMAETNDALLRENQQLKESSERLLRRAKEARRLLFSMQGDDPREQSLKAMEVLTRAVAGLSQELERKE